MVRKGTYHDLNHLAAVVCNSLMWIGLAAKTKSVWNCCKLVTVLSELTELEFPQFNQVNPLDGERDGRFGTLEFPPAA